MKRQPNARVISWLDSQPATLLFITAITAGELRAGIELLPDGQFKNDLERRVEIALREVFDGRVLSYDLHAARIYGRLVGSRANTKVEPLDLQIAAIAAIHRAAIATRNTKHFADCGAELINPWDA
jgi:predicted nucleic acid-binding protein